MSNTPNWYKLFKEARIGEPYLKNKGVPENNILVFKEYLDSPLIIAPLASKSFYANESTLPVAPYDQDEGKPCFLVCN